MQPNTKHENETAVAHKTGPLLPVGGLTCQCGATANSMGPLLTVLL